MDIPVTILSGYLGAGKTTLITHVLSQTHGLRVAVLVNDFGAVNIDASLISSHAEDTITLSNGCVCCTIQDDLGAAIDTQLRREQPPQHILIEASGVAEPARMLRYVESWPGLKRQAIVCVVDIETIRDRARDKFVGRVVCRQIAAANLLILNKADLVDAASGLAVFDWLVTLAPGAGMITSHRAQVDPTLLLEGFYQGAGSRRDELAYAQPGVFFNVAVAMAEPVGLADLQAVLARLPASVHRLKGFVTDVATGQALLVQCVGARYSVEPCPPSADNPPPALVAIGTDRSELQSVRLELAALCTRHRATFMDPSRSGTRGIGLAAAADVGDH